MIVHVDGERWYLHFYHDVRKGSTECRAHKGGCWFPSMVRGAECRTYTDFSAKVAAKRGRDADQFSKYQGRRHALREALEATGGLGMGRELRAKIWRAYWEQVDPLLALGKRERRRAVTWTCWHAVGGPAMTVTVTPGSIIEVTVTPEAMSSDGLPPLVSVTWITDGGKLVVSRNFRPECLTKTEPKRFA